MHRSSKEQLFDRVLIIYLMVVSLVAFLAGVVFALGGEDVFWLIVVSVISLMYSIVTFIREC